MEIWDDLSILIVEVLFGISDAADRETLNIVCAAKSEIKEWVRNGMMSTRVVQLSYVDISMV